MTSQERDSSTFSIAIVRENTLFHIFAQQMAHPITLYYGRAQDLPFTHSEIFGPTDDENDFRLTYHTSSRELFISQPNARWLVQLPLRPILAPTISRAIMDNDISAINLNSQTLIYIPMCLRIGTERILDHYAALKTAIASILGANSFESIVPTSFTRDIADIKALIQSRTEEPERIQARYLYEFAIAIRPIIDLDTSKITADGICVSGAATISREHCADLIADCAQYIILAQFVNMFAPHATYSHCALTFANYILDNYM